MKSDDEILSYIMKFLFKENVCLFFNDGCYYVKKIDSNRDCVLSKYIGESLSLNIPELNLTMNDLYLSNLYDTITNAYIAVFRLVIELYYNIQVSDSTIIIDTDDELPF